MTPRQAILAQRRGQDLIDTRFRLALARILNRTIGRPMTPNLLRLLVAALFPLVRQARELSADLSERAYNEQRPSSEPAPYTPTPYYDDRAVILTIDRNTKSNGRLRTFHLRDSLERHVEQAARERTLSVVRSDDLALGWARVATGRETCAFCEMLVSRGPVYKSRESASFSSHYRCDCIAVPIFNRGDWPGRDEFLRARRLWYSTTQRYSGRDKLNAFRRAVERPGTGTGEVPAIVS